MNTRLRHTLAACAFALAAVPLAQASADEIRSQDLVFAKGAQGAKLSGEIKGYQIVDYKLRAKAGQTLTVDFKSGNRSAYFNLLPPGSNDVAIFVGSSSGDRFQGVLPTDGVYTIRVYQMRNSARRGELARYTLAIALPPAAAHTQGFRQSLDLQGTRFEVTATDHGSLNQLSVHAQAAKGKPVAFNQEIDGKVTGAEVADLNVDGQPELYVYTQSAGSGSYANLVALTAQKDGRLVPIRLPDLAKDAKASRGYMGHDAFAVIENRLVRRFPVYRDGDSNAKPTGGTRQVQYRLTQGGQGWALVSDRVVEY
ncbi:PliI family lysozyme inhibitor of I-type lysozyme [Crenobacter caeni]|uniref:Inhibitor of g-type lysozyme n=1 Tax=Crenobacter caeni TaxID=2705474 RepID=A0A6B2KSK3_9NEIS|nr:PliI family lysozyme inhibitor of I-type lysozyme [Crenobacter caeni]NDV12917.1 hypothetical protein [Crenobacter caeni]